jgi:ribosomal protein S17E
MRIALIARKFPNTLAKYRDFGWSTFEKSCKDVIDKIRTVRQGFAISENNVAGYFTHRRYQH